jgi:hypothetical protein
MLTASLSVDFANSGNSGKRMARKHSKHGPYEDPLRDDEAPAMVVLCWLSGRPTGKTIIWHHPVPKSRGGSDTVPMHLITNFTNSELQRHGMDVEALLDRARRSSAGGR